MHNAVHTLTVHVHPAGNLYNTKREITKLDDFKGLKIRIPNRMVSEALKMYGGVPVAGPVTQIRNGLAKGVYDGTGFTDAINWREPQPAKEMDPSNCTLRVE